MHQGDEDDSCLVNPSDDDDAGYDSDEEADAIISRLRHRRAKEQAEIRQKAIQDAEDDAALNSDMGTVI